MTQVYRVPLVGSYTNRSLAGTISGAKDQQFVNCFPSIATNPITGKQTPFLVKREGTSVSADLSSTSIPVAYGACIFRANSNRPAIFSFTNGITGDAQFFKDDGTQVGSDISGRALCSFITDTTVSGTGYLTATVVKLSSNENEVWYSSGGAWTQITDADFPTTNICATHTHMNGYMFVMTTDGKLYNSDINSITSWTANNYISTDTSTDAGVGVARRGRQIVAFGDASVEFFEIAGNPTGSPLKRIGAINTGAIRQSIGPVIRSVGDTIYWIGSSPGGAGGVFRLNGNNEAEKISNNAVDRAVESGLLTWIPGVIRLYGMSHLLLGGSATYTPAYCLETGYWWLHSMGINTIIAAVGLEPFNSNSTAAETFFTNPLGKIYKSTPNSGYTDNNSSYTMTVQTENLDMDTDKRKFWRYVRVIGDKQSATSNLGVAWSDDDQGSYTTAVNIDMSTSVDTIFRLGASRRRSWKFTHSDNTACRIKAIEIGYEVGNT